MAPSTPSSRAGATFTKIDLALWTLTQCRAKCCELGLQEYGLLCQLRYRLSRWCTAQPDATGALVATPLASEQPPLATLHSPPPHLPTTPLPPLPRTTTDSSRSVPIASAQGPNPPTPILPNNAGRIALIDCPRSRHPRRKKLRTTRSRSR